MVVHNILSQYNSHLTDSKACSTQISSLKKKAREQPQVYKQGLNDGEICWAAFFCVCTRSTMGRGGGGNKGTYTSDACRDAPHDSWQWIIRNHRGCQQVARIISEEEMLITHNWEHTQYVNWEHTQYVHRVHAASTHVCEWSWFSDEVSLSGSSGAGTDLNSKSAMITAANAARPL